MTIVQAIFIWFAGFLPLQVQPCDIPVAGDTEQSEQTDKTREDRDSWTHARRACNADQGDDDSIYNGF